MEAADMIRNMLIELRVDIRNDIKEEITTVTTKIDNTFANLQEENLKLKGKIEVQEGKIKFMERELKKRNVVIFGLEHNNLNFKELENATLSLLNEKLKVETKLEEIDFIRRIGPKEATRGPILLGLTTVKKKLTILNNIKNIIGSDIQIAEDYPKEVVAKRKELVPIVKKLRDENKNATLRYDKILVDGKIWNNPSTSLQTRNEKKRIHSEEDYTLNPPSSMEQQPVNPGAYKKPKNPAINIKQRGRPRSNSLPKTPIVNKGNYSLKDNTPLSNSQPTTNQNLTKA